jgi:hypothetical protein
MPEDTEQQWRISIDGVLVDSRATLEEAMERAAELVAE